MIKILLTVIVLIALCQRCLSIASCGKPEVPQRPNPKPKEDKRIVGGTEARPHSHPWIISLNLGTYEHWCGGSLISVGNAEKTDLVLTAAHCIEGWNQPSLFSVVAGCHTLNQKANGSQTVNVSKLIKHESYDPDNFKNDIAVLKLAEPVTFGQTIQPICLPTEGEIVADNVEVTVAGWGHTKEGAYAANRDLMQVGIPVINRDTCKNNYAKSSSPSEIFPAEMLCAGAAGRDACQMDSGGPLVLRQNDIYVLHGIVSFGEGCAQAEYPGVYARVSKFVPWIKSQIAAHSTLPKQ